MEDFDISERPFSAQLEQWLTAEGPKTIGELSNVFAEKSFAVTILLLMFIPALPLPTGGITHVFEVITILLGGEMVLGAKTLWLPKRFRTRELGATVTQKTIPFITARIRWFERFSRPRWSRLLAQRWFTRVFGVLFIGFATAAALAPPFSGLDTLPSMGAVVLALGIILDDALVVGIGVALGCGGVVLILTVGAALVHLVRSWL